ncbi:unnamed protein product [Arabidopsis lyrata]|nr:unnamed protein product [Arabidopsis lyrata]
MAQDDSLLQGRRRGQATETTDLGFKMHPNLSGRHCSHVPNRLQEFGSKLLWNHC